MFKRFIKKLIPTREELKNNKYLSFLDHALHEPYLWHLNRHSTAKAAFVGIFCALLPIPFQMVVAALIAVTIRCNLPLSISLVWITNPITIPPIFYSTYIVGTHILHKKPIHFDFSQSYSDIIAQISTIGLPLIVGSLTCSIIFGTLAYALCLSYARWKVIHYLKLRKRRTPKKDNC